jgi:hypothetical protein
VIKAIDGLKLKEDDRRKVYFGNAIRMLRLALPDATAAKTVRIKAKPRKAAKAKVKVKAKKRK